MDLALTCDAVKNTLSFDSFDTITRNLLLQSPKRDTEFGSCDLTSGCESENECSNNGICLPQANPYGYNSSYYCHCNTGIYGADCDKTVSEICDGAFTVEIDMTDTYGDGWTFTSFAITNLTTNLVVDNAYDSLCYDNEGYKQYCLDQGCYRYEVSRGYFPQEVGWSFCDNAGGAPTTMDFCIDKRGNCNHLCTDGGLVDMVLYDEGGDGWTGGYYSIYQPQQQKQIFGGTLSDGSEDIHTLCLPQGCSYLLFSAYGSSPYEISYEICGVTGSYTDVYRICIDETTKNCVVESVLQNTNNASCSDTTVDINMFNLLASGWDTGVYSITQSSGSLVASGTLESGFVDTDEVCLSDGCYDFNTYFPSTPSSNIESSSFWSVCGTRGKLPSSSQICVEKAYDLCYGLTGCVYSKSYTHTSDFNYAFITHYDSSIYGNNIDDLFNAHGVNDMCDLADGCYDFTIGAGRDYAVQDPENPYALIDPNRNKAQVCGHTGSLPFSGTLCVSNSATQCTFTPAVDPDVGSSKVSLYLMKLDSYGDGWGSGARYFIKQGSSVVARGTLSDGAFGVDKLSLTKNTCYTFTLQAYSYADEIVWLFCGYIGTAPADSYHFCVSDTGCSFSDAPVDDTYGDPSYLILEDDDFPSYIGDRTPTLAPVASVPSNSPSGLAPTEMPFDSPFYPTSEPTEPSTDNPSETMPTIAPSIADSVAYTPTASPISSKKGSDIYVYSFKASVIYNIIDDMPSGSLSTDTQIKALEYATRRVIEKAGLSVWDIAVSQSYGNRKQTRNISNHNRKLKAIIKKLQQANNKAYGFNQGHNQQSSLEGIDRSKMSEDANTLQSDISVVFASIDISLQWPSSTSSPDTVNGILSNVLTTSWQSGKYDKDIQYAYAYLIPSDTFTVSIKELVVLAADTVQSTKSAEEKPPMDSTYDFIEWNDSSSSQSNAALSSSAITAIVISVVLFSIISCLFAASLYNKRTGNKIKWLSTKAYTNVLTEMSSHGFMASRDRTDSDGMIDFDDTLNPKSKAPRTAKIPSIFSAQGRTKIISGTRRANGKNDTEITENEEAVTIHFNPLQTNANVVMIDDPNKKKNRSPFGLSAMNPVRLQQADDYDDIIL